MLGLFFINFLMILAVVAVMLIFLGGGFLLIELVTHYTDEKIIAWGVALGYIMSFLALLMTISELGVLK